MPRPIILMIGGLLLVVAASIFVLTSGDDTEQADAAIEAAPAYDPAAMAATLADSLSIAEGGTALSDTNGYTVLSSSIVSSSDLLAVLGEVAPPEATAALMSVSITSDDGRNAPLVPLFGFQKSAATWTDTFATAGRIGPHFAGALAQGSLSIELTFFEALPQGTLATIARLSQSPDHLMAAATPEGGAPGATSLTLGVEPLATFRPVEKAAVSLSGSLDIMVSGKPVLTLTAQETRDSLVSVAGSYEQTLRTVIGDTTVRDALGDLETGFWSVPADVLKASCQAIAGALFERTGLSQEDTARILWQFARAHTGVSPVQDYGQDCIGEGYATLLAALSLDVPSKPARAASTVVDQMNRNLSTIARSVRNGSQSDEERLMGLMGQEISIKDHARFLYVDDSRSHVLASGESLVSPSAEPVDVAAYIMTLPIDSYGCYSRGSLSGNSRSTLLKLENDPLLWVLELGFDDDVLINGVTLRPARQIDYCRAVAGRSSCVFAQKDYPGLRRDRCG